MARPAYHDETAFLFELRFRIAGKLCIVRAWEREFQPPNHTRLDLEMIHAGRVIFPRGSMHCGIPSHHSLDGISARECATSCFCIRPGDTDADFFERHTPEQLRWVTDFGEELGCEREARFCDENGNVRRAS